ncbi:putative signal transduction histidine kinase [Methanocella arvoryzae MRE50]|uniref:histidine kinase n=1 Tax=Methanocella arvoryzae (strain DSM 22066 / NBRC 105507 / MRE50) TaxID=351160 RepID=Q0W1B2_METAR|nr:putative signal transduction histidine kinase [Methanocella arvoryzae MRE50]
MRDRIIGLGERSYRKSYYPQLQQKLADLERFKTLLDQIGDAIFMIDMSSKKVADANQSACMQMGYSMAELSKMTLYDIMPDKREELDKLFSGEADSLIVETKLARKDRLSNIYEIRMRRVRFKDMPYIIAVCRDITSRKESERELLIAKSQAELYLDLMGHDINNLNQAAMGFLELALERLRKVCPMSKDDELLINQAIEDLQNSSMLIDNVRKLRKAGSGSLKPVEINVAEMLRSIRDTIPLPQGRDVTISLDLAGECKVCASEMLKDVFINIVGNAIRHSAGPVEVCIRLDTQEINGEKYCRIAVEDNGPGIPDAVKQGLFDIRQRGKARVSGKGLGLYIVKTLVDDLYGQVWVEDRVPGDYTKGSRFVVLLPAIDNLEEKNTDRTCTS